MGLIRHAHPRQQRSGKIRRLADTDPDASGETFACQQTEPFGGMPATAKIGRWSHPTQAGMIHCVGHHVITPAHNQVGRWQRRAALVGARASAHDPRRQGLAGAGIRNVQGQFSEFIAQRVLG